MKKLIIIFILAILLTACNKTQESQDVVEKCIQLCNSVGVSLNQEGGCLSDEIAPDWVCDVVHSPRQAIDNLAENQCQAFREGKAHHFVEVTQDCELIRKV